MKWIAIALIIIASLGGAQIFYGLPDLAKDMFAFCAFCVGILAFIVWAFIFGLIKLVKLSRLKDIPFTQALWQTAKILVGGTVFWITVLRFAR